MNIDLEGIAPDALAALLPRGGRVLVSGCSTESVVMAEAIVRTGGALAGITFTGIFVPGLNHQSYLPDAHARVETFFLTPELKAAGAQVRFLPLCYEDIRRYLQDNPIDAAVMMVGPPDDAGVCSFGPLPNGHPVKVIWRWNALGDDTLVFVVTAYKVPKRRTNRA